LDLLQKSHFLGGIGLGHYAEAYKEAAPVVLGKPPMEWVMIHPHNVVLAFWLNMGLLGVFAFALALRKGFEVAGRGQCQGETFGGLDACYTFSPWAV
jgi:hypothetical protein